MSGSSSESESVLFSQGGGPRPSLESLTSGQIDPTGLSAVLWSHTGVPYTLKPASPEELASETGVATQAGLTALSTCPGVPGATAAETTADGSQIGVVINSQNLLDGGAEPDGPMPFMPTWTPASPVMPFADSSTQALTASLDLQVPYAQAPGSSDTATSSQIVLYFGLTDTLTGRSIAIGMTMFDSRDTSGLDMGVDNGPGGTGAIYVTQPAGQTSPYDVVVPGTDAFEGSPWTGSRPFALEISRSTLAYLLSVVNADALPAQQLSTNLSDYQLTDVSVDAELEYFGQANSIGFSMSDLTIATQSQVIGINPPGMPSTVVGAGGVETISGGETRINAFGGGGPTMLVGGASGGDTLAAASGNTTLVGSCNDLLVGGTGATTILSGSGQNTVFGGAGVHANTLIVGTTGNDEILAGSGTETIFAGSGMDTVWGSKDPTATAVMVGGSGPTLMIGGAGSGQLFAGSGPETLMGGGGEQLLVAGPASTTLVAGNGTDVMFGGPTGSAATMFGSPTASVIISEGGADTILGGPGGDTIFGGRGGDVIQTGSGPTTVVLSQVTTMADNVYLGSGDASIFGGASPDDYVVTYGQSGGFDFVSGFRPGIDHLIFSGYAATSVPVETASGTLVALSDGTQILLAGVMTGENTTLS